MNSININEALGDTRRPLKVGETVEILKDNANDTEALRGDLLKVVSIKGGSIELHDPGDNYTCRFSMSQLGTLVRRVDPPTSEVSDVAELRRQLAEVTRERDEYRHTQSGVAKLKARMRRAERERDELRRDVERLNEMFRSTGYGQGQIDSYAAVADECDELRKNIDDPELDCTDAAHPAWWRGHDHTAKVFCQLVNEILDGKDVASGISGEPWQATKMRVADLRTKLATAEKERDEASETLSLAVGRNEETMAFIVKELKAKLATAEAELNELRPLQSEMATHLCKELAQTRQGFTELGEKYDVAKRQLEWLEKQLHGSDGYIATARELRVEIGERAKERDAEAVRADAAIAEANDARTKLAAAEAEAAARGEFLDELNEITCHKSWHASVKFVRDVLSDHQAIRGNLEHELIQERSRHLVDTLVNRSYAAFMVIRDLLQEKATLEAGAAAMREALQACLNYMGESPEFGHCDKLEQRIVDVLNGTAGRELLERLKKLESENAEWRRLHEALRMQCGHLRSSIVTSIESNSNWCGECDMHSRLSDAVQMEKHNKEQWDREKERRVYYQDIVYAVCNLLDKHLGYLPGQGLVTGTVETPSTMVSDTLEKVLLRCKQLDKAEADAAAMRRTMTENESRLKDVIRRIGVSTTTGWITHELNHVLLDIPSGTAGRELLDRHKAKLAAKDAEIEQERKLSRSCMSQNARLVRKSRTAKTALFEHYRGKIDPAWFGEKSELYKYRTTANPSGVIWRTSDGKSCEASMVGHAWITATAYSSWQECCDDKRTYPCNADGTPLAKPTKDFAEAIEQLLEKDPKLKLEVEAASEEIRQEQSDDDAMLRKLRELLKQCDVCVCLEKEFKIRGPSYDIANETLVTLIAIRDGGGK